VLNRTLPQVNRCSCRHLSTTSALLDDYYKTLGVSKSATAKEIKKAYYQQAKKFHPDANKDDADAEKKFQKVSEAYECLSDPTKKQQYDQLGAAGYQNAQQHGGMGGGGFHGGGGGFRMENDPFDLFNSIFKEFGGQGNFSSYAEQMKNQPQQYDVTLNISLKEACLGVEKRVRMNLETDCHSCSGSGAKPGSKPIICPACNGAGTQTQMQGPFMMRTTCSLCLGSGKYIKDKCGTCEGTGKVEQPKEVKIDVPAGISERERVRIAAHGHEIYVNFQIDQNSKFRRHGEQIHSTVDISISQAILGGSKMIDTIDGVEQIVIKPGTESDTQIRLSRKGSCKLGNKSFRGDHICHLQIKPPKSLTENQRKAILEFAKDEDFSGSVNEEPGDESLLAKAKNKFNSWVSQSRKEKIES